MMAEAGKEVSDDNSVWDGGKVQVISWPSTLLCHASTILPREKLFPLFTTEPFRLTWVLL